MRGGRAASLRDAELMERKLSFIATKLGQVREFEFGGISQSVETFSVRNVCRDTFVNHGFRNPGEKALDAGSNAVCGTSLNRAAWSCGSLRHGARLVVG